MSEKRSSVIAVIMPAGRSRICAAMRVQTLAKAEAWWHPTVLSPEQR
jgi:hypothetical protein